MSGGFFQFEAFDTEIARKLDSLVAGVDSTLRDYRALLARLALPDAEQRQASRLCDRLLKVDMGGAGEDHFTHTARVSASYLMRRGPATYASIALSLCHNAIEAGFFDEIRADFLPEEAAAGIRLLTIDRARERQPDYLRGYYEGIAGGPPGLVVLKALDKLDNTLWWVRFDVESHDVNVVLDHACPRVAGVDPELASYLERLTRYVLTPAARAKHAARDAAASSGSGAE